MANSRFVLTLYFTGVYITNSYLHIVQLVRQSQIVQSVMYSYDAVISSYIIPAIHSWFGRSASEKVVFLRRFLLVLN